MDPTEENFASLQHRFASEIAELRAELRVEQVAALERDDDSLANELQEALRQSEELLEQLGRLREIAAHVQAVPGRTFTAEEVDALRYFGFNLNKIHHPRTSASGDASTTPTWKSGNINSNNLLPNGATDLAAHSPPRRSAQGQQLLHQGHLASPLPLRPATSLSPERYQQRNNSNHMLPSAAATAVIARGGPPIRATATPVVGAGDPLMMVGAVSSGSRSVSGGTAVPGRHDDSISNASSSHHLSQSALLHHSIISAVPVLHHSHYEDQHPLQHQSRSRLAPRDTIHVPLVSPEKESDPTTTSSSVMSPRHRMFARDRTAEIGVGGAGGRSPPVTGGGARATTPNNRNLSPYSKARLQQLQQQQQNHQQARTHEEKSVMITLREENLAMQRQIANMQARERDQVIKSGFHVGATDTGPRFNTMSATANTRSTATSPLRRQQSSPQSPVRQHLQQHQQALHAVEVQKLTERITHLERANTDLKDRLKTAAGAVSQLTGNASPSRLGNAVAGLDRVLAQGNAALKAARFIRRPRPLYEATPSSSSGNSVGATVAATRCFAQQVAQARSMPEWVGVLPFVVDAQRGIAHSITGLSVPCDGATTGREHQPQQELVALLESTLSDPPLRLQQLQPQQQRYATQNSQQQHSSSSLPSTAAQQFDHDAILRVAHAAAQSPLMRQTQQQQRASSKSASPVQQPRQSQQQHQQQQQFSRANLSPHPREPAEVLQQQQQQQPSQPQQQNRSAAAPAVPLVDELSAVSTPQPKQPSQHRAYSEAHASSASHQQQHAVLSPAADGASPSVELMTLQRLQEERDALVALKRQQEQQQHPGSVPRSEARSHHAGNISVAPAGNRALITPPVGQNGGSSNNNSNLLPRTVSTGRTAIKGATSYASASKSPAPTSSASLSATRRFIQGSGNQTPAAVTPRNTAGGKNFIERNRSNVSSSSFATSSSAHNHADAAAHSLREMVASSNGLNKSQQQQSSSQPFETVLSRIGPEVLRTMTPAEIEVLKRVALTQQLREQKRKTEQQLSNNFRR